MCRCPEDYHPTVKTISASSSSSSFVFFFFFVKQLSLVLCSKYRDRLRTADFLAKMDGYRTHRPTDVIIMPLPLEKGTAAPDVVLGLHRSSDSSSSQLRGREMACEIVFEIFERANMEQAFCL